MSFLALVTAVSGLAEVAVDVVKVELEAIDHVFADLGEDAGGRRHVADAQFLGGVRRRRQAQGNNAAQQRRTEPS